MDQAQAFEAYFLFLPILMGVSLAGIAAMLWASVAYRRSRGKPIFFTRVENAAYAESNASGHSNRTWFTRLGGANRVLVVAVVDRRLVIRPRFPFNLLFMPEIYGLEHEVPLDQITSIQPHGDRSGRVDLQFSDSTAVMMTMMTMAVTTTNELHHVTLYLRDPDRFVAALGGKRPH